MRTLVCIPTFNEAASIPVILREIYALDIDVDVLVIDDNSPDGTGAIVDEIASTNPRIHRLPRASRGGFADSYLAGFRWGFAQNYDAIVQMDADGSHRAVDLPLLLAALENCDVVIGSRWTKGGAVVNWPKHREVLSRGGNFYARVLLGVEIRDVTAGFKAYRSGVLSALDLDSIVSEGYCFQVDLVNRARNRGYRICEVPIVFVERELGVSKMNKKIVQEALKRVTVWGLAQRLLRKRY